MKPTVFTKNSQLKAYFFALLAVLFWATAASAFKLTLEFMPYPNLLLLSSFTSSVIFLIIIFIQKKIYLLKKNTKRQLLTSMIMGLLNPFLYYLILFKAYTLLPAHQAQPLNFVWPLVIVLLSIIFLKQRIKPRNIIALLISFLGIIIISSRGKLTVLNISEPYGVFLALVSSVFWGLFFVINMIDSRDEMIKLFLSFSFGFSYTLIYLFLIGSLVMPGIKELAGSIYIGFFEMGITFYIWLKALKISKTTASVSNLIYLTPFISMLFIRLVVQEQIHTSAVVGLFLIVSGIIVQPGMRKKTHSR